MKAIGFANEFYTLWDVTVEPMYVSVNGQHRQSGNKTIRTYFQNLSTNLNKAKDRFTELTGISAPEPDEDLKGISKSWTTTEDFEVYSSEEFNFGKYAGKNISECEDIEYLKWMFNEISGDRRELVSKVLVTSGMVRYDEDTICSKEKAKLFKHNASLKTGHHYTAGEKVELDLTVRSAFNFNGHFGTTYVYEFYTSNLEVVKYMGSKCHDINEGDTLSVKATIKHSEYQGEKETKLLRIKIKK